METTAIRGRLSWHVATVVSVTWETASVVTIVLDPPGWTGHRAGQHLIYRDELGQCYDGVHVSYTLTRSQPAGWTGHTGRIGPALLAKVAWPAAANPLAYICGPTSFVETAAAGLVGLGYPPQRVRTERFGATGGR